MHVLLVEDSPTLRREISQYILNAGHTVTVANDGETAVQVMELGGADLIICDIEMPGLDGYETVSIIRESLGEFWVPIIFLTKLNKVSDFLAGLEVGADDYLIKPVNQKVLHAKMKVLERFIIMQQRLNEALNTHEQVEKFDRLTHVYNIEPFQEIAKLQWSIQARQSKPISILAIGIDHYEEYKTHYGKEKASICLQKVATQLSSSIHRPGDFVGKLTEDYFVVLLPDTTKSGAEKVSERMCLAIESLLIEHKKSRVFGVVSISIGGYSALNLKDNELEKTVNRAKDNLEITLQEAGNTFLVNQSHNMELSNI